MPSRAARISPTAAPQVVSVKVEDITIVATSGAFNLTVTMTVNAYLKPSDYVYPPSARRLLASDANDDNDYNYYPPSPPARRRLVSDALGAAKRSAALARAPAELAALGDRVRRGDGAALLDFSRRMLEVHAAIDAALESLDPSGAVAVRLKGDRIELVHTVGRALLQTTDDPTQDELSRMAASSTSALNSVSDMLLAVPDLAAVVRSSNDQHDTSDKNSELVITAFQNLLVPGYDALLPKADALISLLDQTLAVQTANDAAMGSVADAMQAILGAMNAVAGQLDVNSQAILGAYSPDLPEYDAYGACIAARSPVIVFSFTLEGGGTQSTRRRLLQAAPAPGAADKPAASYQGYELFTAATEEYALEDTAGTYRPRYVGVRGNTVFVGLLLHQIRRRQADIPNNSSAQCTSSFGDLSIACTPNALKLTKTEDLGPIGNDPVFNEKASMYRPELANKPEQWYAAGEMNSAGSPYGFFHHPVTGYEDGYPILIDPRISQKRAKQMLTYIREGKFLSATLSKSMTMQLVSFNADTKVIGYWRLDLTWNEEGVISGKPIYQGLPAVTYNKGGALRSEGERLQFVPEMFVVFFVVAYMAMTAADVYEHVFKRTAKLQTKVGGRTVTLNDDDLAKRLEDRTPQATGGHRGDRSSGRYQSGLTPFWVGFEVVQSLLMMASLIALYIYNFDLTPKAPLMITADVYDADQFAPARPFMLRRDRVESAAPGAPRPGTLDRWRLAEDFGGLGDVSRTLAHINSMYTVISLYNALQGVILLLLIVRLVNLISFQPKLSLISGTLVRISLPANPRPSAAPLNAARRSRFTCTGRILLAACVHRCH